jgi:hypothetical protein
VIVRRDAYLELGALNGRLGRLNDQAPVLDFLERARRAGWVVGYRNTAGLGPPLERGWNLRRAEWNRFEARGALVGRDARTRGPVWLLRFGLAPVVVRVWRAGRLRHGGWMHALGTSAWCGASAVSSGAPEVSVVVATRDRWEHLAAAALPAALGQQDVELELIVVDDGSGDGTQRGLAGIADPRLRVLRSERSEGVAAARNRGVAAARAEWVAFLDDDDLWSPRKLRAQLDAGRAAGAAFVYAAAVFIDEHDAILRDDPAPDPGDVAAALRRSDVVGGPSTVLARTALVRELGGFDPALALLADWDLWLRLADAGPAAACHEVLVAYREHAGNMSADTGRRPFAELDLLAGRHGLASELDGVLFTHWVAGQRRRAGRRGAAARAYLEGARRFRSPGLLARGLIVPLGEGAMGLPQRLRGRPEDSSITLHWLRA